MRRKLLTALLLLSITTSSFSTFGYVPVYAAEYEDDKVVTEAVEESEQNVETEDIVASNIIDSGTYDTWSWSLDADGVLLIEGTDIKLGDLSVWPWRGSSGEKIKSAKVTGSGSGSMDGLFAGCTVMTSVDLSGFDTKNVTAMSYMFWCCYKLSDLDVSNFDTSNVTSMENMFGNCTSLTSLDVSSFDTHNVENMYGVFWGCSGLTDLDVSNFNTSNVKNMYAMFNKCSKLTSLDVSNFNTANVEDMSSVFSSCSSLTELNLDNFDTSNVKNISHLFFGCTSLTDVDVSTFDTGNVTDMIYMFYNCSNLTNLDISNFDAANVTNMSYMLYGCSGLTKIESPYNITAKADLPSGITWLDESGNTVTTMYKDRSESVTYSKKGSQQQDTFSYTIQFNGNGADSGAAYTLTDCKKDVVYPLPNNRFALKGYTFSEWNTMEDGSGVAYADNATVKNLTTKDGDVVNLYAQWKPITYIVIYNKNDGSGAISGTTGTKYGLTYSLSANTFTRTGYTLTGWNTKADGSGVAYAANAAVKNLTTEDNSIVNLYAQWKPITYSIVYNKNGGNRSMPSMTGIKYDSTCKLNKNLFTKSGYIFTGWNTKANGSGKAYKNQASVKNLTSTNGQKITLYAQWQKVTTATAKKPTLSNVATRKLVVSYKAVTGAKGYKIQYATNSKMKKAKTIYVTGTKKIIPKAAKGKTYYIRVAAYKYDSTGKKIYGKYSPIQNKKITK